MTQHVTQLLGPQAFWNDLITSALAVKFNSISSHKGNCRSVCACVRAHVEVRLLAELSRSLLYLSSLHFVKREWLWALALNLKYVTTLPAECSKERFSTKIFFFLSDLKLKVCLITSEKSYCHKLRQSNIYYGAQNIFCASKLVCSPNVTHVVIT